MLIEQKIVVRDLITEAWNNGQLAAVDHYTTTSFKHHCPLQPAGVHGRSAYKEWIAHLRSAFSGMALTPITHLVAEGDQVIGRWRLTGQHTGNLSIIRPTNMPVKLDIMAAFRLYDDRIYEAAFSYDLFTLVRQLGLVPEIPGISPSAPHPALAPSI